MNLESVLNVNCSKANNKESLPVDCNLLDELLSDKYLQQQNEVRTESDMMKQDELKMKMPVLLPSGIFKGAKGAKNLVKHSGVIAIDIDFKDNQHITNFKDFKSEICKISNVAYCGLSVRGKGFFLIIPIAYTDKHKLHFKFIESFFKGKGLVIDQTCINVNRLRYYSYDQEAYYNHGAKPLQAYYMPPEPKSIQCHQKGNKGLQLAGNVYYNATAWVLKKGVEFVEGKKHEYIFLLSSYLVSKGVKKSDAESWIDNNVLKLTEITTNCIDYPYTNFTAGKEIAAKQAPFKRHALAKAFTQPPTKPLVAVTPPPEPCEPTAYTLEQLKAMAMKHLNNTMIRDKQSSKANYFKCWSEGMGGIIQAAGLTQQQFLNSINQ